MMGRLGGTNKYNQGVYFTSRDYNKDLCQWYHTVTSHKDRTQKI